MSLRLKFNIVLGLILLAGISAAAVVIRSHLQEDARGHATHTAKLLMAAAEGVRSYTVSFIKPELDQRLAVEFLPQTVPAFAATETIMALRKQFPEYSYKEAVLNPTNPRDRTTDWEADIVNAFRADTSLKEIKGERAQGPIQAMYIAKPIKVTSDSCLSCHSTPAAAPPSMLRLYGEANGFGWKKDEIIGAQIVSVPLSVATKASDQLFQTIVGAMAGVGVLALLVGNLLLGPFVARQKS